MADEIAPQGEQVEGTSGTDWKAEARKWEQRAKADKQRADANEQAAAQLSTIEAERKTDGDRISALEKQLADSQRAALISRVQGAHGINDEDAAMFLTGADEATLTAQAARLAERATPVAGAAARIEGPAANSVEVSPERAFMAKLFNK